LLPRDDGVDLLPRLHEARVILLLELGADLEVFGWVLVVEAPVSSLRMRNFDGIWCSTGMTDFGDTRWS
jgi:hypothetical protein